MRITILTNGPGELWGWVRPVSLELRRRGHSVALWLLPCPFASGHEREAASLLGVDKLTGPSLRYAGNGTDCVVQMGGDLLFGSRLAKAADAPLYCYTYGPKKGMDRAEKIMTAFPGQVSNAEVIGDLVKDALLMDRSNVSTSTWGSENHEPTPLGEPFLQGPRLLILPGSRPKIRAAALPWALEVVKHLRARAPGLRVRTLFPPFIPESETAPYARLHPLRGPVPMDADFALTQPGTNTLELMHCGIPSLVVAPSDFLELIPVSGLKGMLASLPVVGKGIRRAAVLRVLNRWGGAISLPNRISGQHIMAEMYGDITPRQVAERICDSLNDPEALAQQKKDLLALSGPGGATGRLCNILGA